MSKKIRNKINMYQEVPEQFHNRLCDTLESLENKKVVRFTPKRFAVACAVALLATSTITVGAMELFQWYQAARENFGTDKELENKLTNQGIAIPAEDSHKANDITMTALQAVKTGKNYYLLAGFEWPENIEWNGDILFEKTEVMANKEFRGCTVNFAGEPDEKGIVYLDIDLLGEPNVEYAGEVTVAITNLIQTSKTAYVDTLVEAQWELTFTLPTGEDIRTYLNMQDLSVSGHSLELERVELTAFDVKLYTEENMARHASCYSNMELAAVQYEDGSRVQNYGGFLQHTAAKDEADKFNFRITLQNAVDVDKVSALVFVEDGAEFMLSLGGDALMQDGKKADTESSEYDKYAGLCELLQEATEAEGKGNAGNIYDITSLRMLYARHDNAIITDSKNIYLWDGICDRAEIIMNLTEYGFNAKQGGDIAFMPGGVILVVHPTADSDNVYMLDMDSFDVVEADAEKFWPVPRYEDYRSSFFTVAEKENLPEGVYAAEGYEAQGSAYVLYSGDGSLEQIELVDLNKK